MSKDFQYNKGPLFAGGSPRDFALSTHEYGVRLVDTAQRFIFGTRYLTWDGRVFKYGKSGAVCRAGRGCAFYSRVDETGPDYELLSGTQSIGDTQITIAAADHHVAYAEDELAGGLVLISDSEVHSTAPSDIDMDPQNRFITGNDVSAEDAILTIYLESPLTRATTALTYAFLMPSLYSDLRSGNTMAGTYAYSCSQAGVPAAYITAADKTFWVQTWGPLWAAMQTTVGKTAHAREVCFRWDGSIGDCTDDDAFEEYQQRCGFIMDRTDGSTGGTFIMLQVSI